MLTDYIFTSDITQLQAEQLYKAFNKYFGEQNIQPEKNIVMAIDKAVNDELLSWMWYDTKTLLDLKCIAFNIL